MDEYFEFGSSPLHEQPEEDNIYKSKNYNDLNDETFGIDEDFGGDDWVVTHEKMALDFDQQRGKPEEDQGVTPKMLAGADDLVKEPMEEDMEKCISQLVLDDEDDEMFESKSKQTPSSQPISIKSSNSNLKHLFGPGSPPSLYDPNLLSPTSKENIWGAAHAEKAKTKSAEDSLKAILNIGGKVGGDTAWADPSILQAVPGSGKKPPKVVTLEQLEQGILPDSSPRTPVTPQPIGTPPRGQTMPIGTPPRGIQSQPSPQLNEMVRYWTQKFHQVMGGRVSPTEISSMIIRMHQTSGRISPDYLHQMLIKRATIGPMLNSPNFSPGSRSPMMQRPPHSPFMPMPYPNQGRMTPRLHQGSPMGRGMGMSPMGRGYPGTPHPSFGLTPMHPRIPPLRPATDPGMMRRHWGRTPNRGRPDGRFQRQGQYQPPGDEYANLMTQREKDWVIRIQMLQLHTDNPMLSDYYYQITAQRRQSKNRDKDGEKNSDEKTGKNNEELGRGDADERRGRNDGEMGKQDDGKKTQQAKLEPRAYKPAQFEGALGRVTSSSVNNPRQLIDIHSMRVEEEEDLSKSKDHGKKRKTLLSIEHMYDVFLKAEDVAIQLNSLPESDTGALLEKRQQLLNDLYKSLKVEEKTEQSNHEALLQILSIRKGRKLVARLLPLLTHIQGSRITDLVALHVLTILKRESADLKKSSSDGCTLEQTLPILFHSISKVIQCKSMGEVLIMAKNMTEEPQSQVTSTTTGAIQHKFGLSLILCALSRAETLFSSTTAKDLDPAIIQEWAVCVNAFAKAICELPKTSIAEPLNKYPLSLEHFKHFVSKQSFSELEAKLRPITEEASLETDD